MLFPVIKMITNHLFGDNNSAYVVADFYTTGKEVTRGWGQKFKEAMVTKIRLQNQVD